MSMGNARALLIAAPASNSGKTTLTLALLRAFKKRGTAASSFKIGPDYIDPVFHHHASARPCVNIDPWGMRKPTRAANLKRSMSGADLVIGEAVMGLFDGARDGSGSSADLAAEFNIPIILVVQAAGQSNSVSALLHGFNSYRADTRIAGVIFNGVGSKAHGEILRNAAKAVDIPCLGLVPKSADLQLPRRHLGLVQADEKSDLEAFLNKAADIVSEAVDLQALEKLATSAVSSAESLSEPPFPNAQHIAVAHDTAFRFIYPHLEAQWQSVGIKVSHFSPLANEAPAGQADFIYLPGGYPELHLPALAKAHVFLEALREAKARAVPIYGECGGYMVMGEEIISKEGEPFAMAGILPIKTSFASPKLHLGYRQVTLQQDGPLGDTSACFRAHEFHYAKEISSRDEVMPLFHAFDALKADLGAVGAVSGSAFGSFIHLIDKAE